MHTAPSIEQPVDGHKSKIIRKRQPIPITSLLLNTSHQLSTALRIQGCLFTIEVLNKTLPQFIQPSSREITADFANSSQQLQLSVNFFIL